MHLHHSLSTYRSSSRPVHKGIHGARRVVVDHRGHGGQIQTPGRHIGRHHHRPRRRRRIAIFQRFHRLEAGALCWGRKK